MVLSQTGVGIAAALLSTATWAVCAVIFKKLGEYLDPLGMTLAKTSISVVLLLPVVIFSDFTAYSIYQYAVIAVSGILGIAIGDSLFFAALNRLSPLALAVILLAGPDICSGLLGFFCLGEMPAMQVWLGVISIFIGTWLLIFPEASSDPSSVKTTKMGLLFGILSLLATSFSMVVIKPVLTQYASLPITMLRMFFGSIVILLYGFLAGKIPSWIKPFQTGKYRWGFGGAVVLVTYGGFWLSLVAVKNLNLIVASALMSLEPVLVLMFMILFMKHKTSLREILGLLFAISGVFMITFFNK